MKDPNGIVEKRFQNGSHILYYYGTYSKKEPIPVQGACVYLKKGRFVRFYTNERGSVFSKSIMPDDLNKTDVKNILDAFSKMNGLIADIHSPAGAYAKALALAAAGGADE